MQIKKDAKGPLYIEWQQAAGGYKRAWVQHREPDRDWANTPEGRYLNVVRIAELGAGPAGNATDFPILALFLMNRSSLLLLPLFLQLQAANSRMNDSISF
ncbi:hypothetical protein [uncultured Vibrio sp.]|uniref:hypothetical protein n=1 Tax=uncultured Vibrio sp. TaxID=114054 RepID=UPI0026222141|nr:hypothetical protein [uncultured Vibrio sp.]